jgi:hypothetical protein
VQVTPLFVNDATALNVAVSGVIPALVAVNAGTFPVPELPANPIASLVLDQVNVAPGTLLLKTTDGTDAPAQTVMLLTGFMVGTGLTVIVNWIGVPVQVTPLLVSDATALNVAVSGAVPAFVAVNAGTFPVPELAPRPIAAFVLDQLNTAPGVLLEKTTDGTDAPSQTVMLVTGSIAGTGLIVTVLVEVVKQPREFDTVRLSVNEPLAPAVTFTNWPLVAVVIDPLPVIIQL